MNKNESFFKYMPLRDLRRFIDILINEHLYAARFTDLNDPMEGMFMVDFEHRDLIDLMKREKYKNRICSLSSTGNHSLMWSHYADGHRGCCIEVSLRSNKLQANPIEYTDTLPRVDHNNQGRNVLLCKSKLWKYEQEVRVFSRTKWVCVNIQRVTLGCRVPKSDVAFYTDLIARINPCIHVDQMCESKLNEGFNNI